MVDSAVRARQVYRRLVVIDPITGETSPLAEPDLEGIPSWAARACQAEILFVSPQDDYTGLWVETPFVVNHLSVYVRCSSDTILIERGEGYVAALGPCPWKFVT